MKKEFLLIAVLLLIANTMFAQMGINDDGSQPDSSAGLDIKFTNKGLLPPRMTHAQMDAIATPANGLIIFCTDCSTAVPGTLAMFMNGAWYISEPSCLGPHSPTAGTHLPGADRITWNWNVASGAAGYKWNTTNNYATASNMGTVNSKIETGLICNTQYTRYAWAFNGCGNSPPVTLSQFTAQNPQAPVSGVHNSSPTQILWQWNTVPGVTGYKWNNTNDYATAIDMITTTTKFEAGLTCVTSYTRYVWAYNTCGHSAATVLTQSTSACTSNTCPPTFTDSRDGKTYSAVLIGTQCWMAQNLNNNTVFPADCYDGNAANCSIYGGLYNWFAAMNGSVLEGATGICPPGWYIPSDDEWGTLIWFLGGVNIAGDYLKEAGTAHWASPNMGATNLSGFTALPGGRGYTDYFVELKSKAYFWSSSRDVYDDTKAYSVYLSYNNSVISGSYSNRTINRFSVRCIKN
jgi:uncharacterized protein (TIGR02145 family)